MLESMNQFKTMANAAAEALRGTEARDIYLSAVRLAWRLTESPIEVEMAQALICCRALNQGRAPWIALSDLPLTASPPLIVQPQRRIGDYRADFAVIFQPTKRRLVVECDGYEFHDRTIEQAAADKARDRYFLTQGWPVMRFTGSEITRQIDICLADVVAYLTGGASV